jgi:hypothetical protein
MIFYVKSPHFIRIYRKVMWPFYKKERFFFFLIIRFHIFSWENDAHIRLIKDCQQAQNRVF